MWAETRIGKLNETGHSTVVCLVLVSKPFTNPTGTGEILWRYSSYISPIERPGFSSLYAYFVLTRPVRDKIKSTREYWLTRVGSRRHASRFASVLVGCVSVVPTRCRLICRDFKTPTNTTSWRRRFRLFLSGILSVRYPFRERPRTVRTWDPLLKRNLLLLTVTSRHLWQGSNVWFWGHTAETLCVCAYQSIRNEDEFRGNL